MPRPSQLTQSKWSQVYSAREEIEDADENDPRAVADAIDNAASTVRDVASEYADAAEAMQAAGERNQSLADQLEALADELEAIASAASEIADEKENEENELPDPANPKKAEEPDEGPTAADQKEEALGLDWEPCE